MLDAFSTNAALSVAGHYRPNLVVLDPEIRDCLEPRLVSDLVAASPASHICIVTRIFEAALFIELMMAGARGDLLKHNPDGQFIRDALFVVGRYGGVVVDPAVSEIFRSGTVGQLTLRMARSTVSHITRREQEVLNLLVDGATDNEIAALLGISRGTVESHVGHLVGKLGVRTRTELGVLAIEDGLAVRGHSGFALVP